MFKVYIRRAGLDKSIIAKHVTGDIGRALKLAVPPRGHEALIMFQHTVLAVLRAKP